jgi:acyl carrier protein
MTLPTRDDVITIVAEEARIDVAKLSPTATLLSLGIASLDVISVLFGIEDRFGVVIAPEDFASCDTVGEFVDIIMTKVMSV